MNKLGKILDIDTSVIKLRSLHVFLVRVGQSVGWTCMGQENYGQQHHFVTGHKAYVTLFSFYKHFGVNFSSKFYGLFSAFSVFWSDNSI